MSSEAAKLTVTLDPKGELLNAALRQGSRQISSWGALYFFGEGLNLSPEAILAVAIPHLDDKPAFIYLLGNGDVAFTWKGAQRLTRDALLPALYATFAPHDAHGTRDRYYDMMAQGDAMRQFFMYRLELFAREKLKKQEARPAATADEKLSERRAAFRKTAPERLGRTSPHTLIYTDQIYSGRMIVSLVGIHYKTHLTDNAEECLNMLVRFAPDLVLIDLQYTGAAPDAMIAALRAIDPALHIAVVSAGPAEPAPQAGINAFVIKPFTTAKLHALINGKRV